MKRFATILVAFSVVASGFAQSWSLDSVVRAKPHGQVEFAPVLTYRLGVLRDVPVVGDLDVLSFIGRGKAMAGFAVAKSFPLGRDVGVRLGAAYVTEDEVRPTIRAFAGVSVRL